MRYLLTLLLILVAGPALAQPLVGGDDGAGTTAAALPDEASECRYLLKLCSDADAAINETRRALADTDAALSPQASLAVSEYS